MCVRLTLRFFAATTFHCHTEECHTADMKFHCDCSNERVCVGQYILGKEGLPRASTCTSCAPGVSSAPGVSTLDPKRLKSSTPQPDMFADTQHTLNFVHTRRGRCTGACRIFVPVSAVTLSQIISALVASTIDLPLLFAASVARLCQLPSFLLPNSSWVAPSACLP